MIKTELEHEEDQENSLPTKYGSKIFIATAVIAVLLLGGFIFAIIAHNSVTTLPDNPSKYQGVNPLPLGSNSSNPVTPTRSNQSDYTQSSNEANSLGSAYTGLQNVPQGKNTPTTSPLQSSGQSTNTGQTINPALPY